MIYTVTLNPALDYAASVEELNIGGTNRTVYEKLLPGGKGLNVSAVLQELGIPSTAFGFVAGFTGEEICRRVREYGINTRFLKLEEGNSRINVKLKSGWPQTRGETEINGMGPQIPPEKLEELKGQLSEIGEGDTLVLAGSIPPSLPATVYRDIMEQLQSSGARIAVDAAGEALRSVLGLGPFLIKPNEYELGALFGLGPVNDRDGVVCLAGRLQRMGARNVLVSRGAKGAVLLDQNGAVHECGAPKGTVKNTVGSGDSMVAGFRATLERGGDYREALRLAVAAGSAGAFSEELATGKEILAVLGFME